MLSRSRLLAKEIVSALQTKGWTVSCAETLTGGGIVQELLQIPGSSRVLGFGAITYSDTSKTEILGVDPETIRRFGAVSEETAQEMAAGIAAVAHAELGLAVTGIAGPGGGTPEKPVGMVCFALKLNDRTITETCRFGNLGREAIMDRSVQKALELLAETL